MCPSSWGEVAAILLQIAALCILVLTEALLLTALNPTRITF